MKVRIGLVGLGHLGKIHLKCLLMLSDIYEVTGIYDVNLELAKQIANENGLHAFNSIDELLEVVDALDIVSTTSTHYELAKLAMTKQKHLFIEKPVTALPEEGEELLKLEEKAGICVQVGHVERFNPAYLAIKEVEVSPLFIESHRLAEFNIRGTDVSVVLDLMIHDLDLILHLVKSPVKEVRASGVGVVSSTADISNARIEFENGCVANVTASRLSMKRMRKMRIFQEDAYLSLDFLEKETQLIRLLNVDTRENDESAFIMETSKGPKKLSIEVPKIEEVNAIMEELRAFSIAISGNQQTMVPLRAGVEAVKLAHEINRQIMDKSQEIKGFDFQV